MATFEALRLIRLKRAELPNVDLTTLLDVVQHVQADGANHDFEAALALDGLVAVEAESIESVDFYRLCIEACIVVHRPLWVRTIPYGRKSFVQKLERDAAQCFEASGLMDDPPTPKIIEWWDAVAGKTRSATDIEKMRQARAAEKLSLEFERKRLAELGIDREPVWMAIEDNWAGYDILSYDHGSHGLTTRMVEVKSTTASPLRFFLTRNEWKKCLDVGEAYQFHVWDMKAERLFVRTVSEISEHVPEDKGAGRWSTLEIRIGAS